MMVIINLMRPSGIFEYIAIKSAKWGKGEPFRIMATFAVVTAILSALLDNVTTVLLITPVTVLIADALEIDPIPYLVSCALASNIGGTATLIGDPPNIMIASKAYLTFMDFIYHLTPIVIVLMVVYILTIKVIWGKKLRTKDTLKKRIMEMDERGAIKDPVMLMKSLFVLALSNPVERREENHLTALRVSGLNASTFGVRPAMDKEPKRRAMSELLKTV